MDRPHLIAHIKKRLASFEENIRPLPGVGTAARRDCLVSQIVDSIHRVKYVSAIRTRPLDPQRADPKSSLFDPLKAAILKQQAGDTEEACWLVFLFVHFGKHSKGRWRYASEVYGQLNAKSNWTWQSVAANPQKFSKWIQNNAAYLGRPGGGFGNHRKYESWAHTPATMESYIAWVKAAGTHSNLFDQALLAAKNDSKKAFCFLYRSMDAVYRFGRLAKFDYLTMIGKAGLASIQPGSAFMQGATGPFEGAMLLFGLNARPKTQQLDQMLVALGDHLGIGMQEVEDALCNWQKSPDKFVAFRG